MSKLLEAIRTALQLAALFILAIGCFAFIAIPIIWVVSVIACL